MLDADYWHEKGAQALPAEQTRFFLKLSREKQAEVSGWMDKSLEAVQQAWMHDPDDPFPSTFALKTMVCREKLQRDVAEKWVHRALEADPQNVEALYLLMALLQPVNFGTDFYIADLGVIENDILRSFNLGMKLSPRLLRAVTWTEMTMAYFTHRRKNSKMPEDYFKDFPHLYRMCSRCYEKYLELNPEDSRARCEYMQIAAWADDWDEAAKQLEAVGENVCLPVFGSKAKFDAMRKQIEGHGGEH